MRTSGRGSPWGLPASCCSSSVFWPAAVFMTEAVMGPTVLSVVVEVVRGGAVTTVFTRYGQSAAYG